MRKARRPAAIAMALALALQLGTVVPAAAAGINSTAGYENGNSPLNLNLIARYASGQYNVDGGVMEIAAYSQSNGYAYAINGQSGLLAAIPLGDLTAGISVARLSGTDIDVKALVEAADSSFRYGDMTSVAISPDNTILAAALQAEGYNDAGRVALFTCNADGTLTLKGLVETGVQPDMVTFADNDTVLTADEGEPREGYGDGIADPRGSVTVVDVSALTSEVVGFDAFDGRRDELAASGVVLKKGVNPSTDLEPEYIAVSGGKAYITLQENNAIAVLDLASRTFDGIYSAGFEDYSVTPIDIDKKDDAYASRTYGSLMGIRMPDGIAAFQVDGKTYLVTANEGDAREWGNEDLGTFYLSEDEQDFGEEGVTSPTGAITGENSGLEGKVVFFKVEDFDGLDSGKDYLFGGRTFTIYEAGENGVTEVFTSGNDFETLTARYLTDYYNCSNDNTVVDDRSGKKGPEAESVTVGTVDGRTYAFVALERTGGVMVYDVTEPASAQYVNYINTRDFASVVEGSEEYEDGELDKWVTGGDVAPEGLLFLSDAVSPTGEALLLAACEVSGTVAVYQVGGEPLSILPFTDVEARDAQAVRYVCENGLMAGITETQFAPDQTLTRGEMTSILWKLAGSPQVAADAAGFVDTAGADCAGAVAWAADNGVVSGYGDSRFGPADPVTREQMSLMLLRYAQYAGMDTAQGGMTVREFADYDQIAGYALETVAWTVEAGLLTGNSSDTLAPGQAATRVQTAQALLALSQMAG
ncbi:choice-of-anchor I family protein [Flavonifractor sp.]|uniref:choice-of-anchor I family protein n=1 Tax=Flavonifractor sp. TaxID=2049025 RepID=UPI0025BBBCE2|nr:choice-of-anchor I family protein [Flavonifractor sp.]